ncbi:MAG: uroporphyrinogen decarboxylase family protein [bacterium]
MNSRERFKNVINHKEPDRVPVDYWATSEINNKILEHFNFSSLEEILEKFHVDFRYINGPEYIGPEQKVREDGSAEDIWGVPRVQVDLDSGGGYKEVINFPLQNAKTIEEIKDYDKWPDPDWFDYSCVRRQIAEVKSKDKIAVFMGDRMNRVSQLKPAMYLRGIEQILLDLALNPEIAEFLFTRIAEFYREYAKRTFEAAGSELDIFMTGDDFGTQNGPFMSQEMFKTFLLPGFKSFTQLGKKHGYYVAHHSCGSIKPLIPDLIESGLDILNPVQPDVYDMDRKDLKERFGKDLVFHGSISIQKTLPMGTPEDIQNEVKERFETLGPDGGFIFCTAHNIQFDTPVENILALFEAYEEFGRY